MDTAAFFDRVLPSEGIIVTAIKKPLITGEGCWFDHHIHDSVRTAAAFATSQNSKGEEVFYARASFREKLPRNGMKGPDGDKIPHSGVRSKQNVLLVRALAIDLDVGAAAGRYPTQHDALKGIVPLLNGTGLPKPMIVNSGRGVHIYWTFGEDIPGHVVAPVAEGLATAAKRFGVRYDTSITGNLCALLRPAGCLWRKEDPPRLVSVLRDAPDVPFAQLQTFLAPFITHQTALADDDDEWRLGDNEFPPVAMEEIEKHCNAVKALVADPTDVPEPLWRAVLGLAKHCVGGVEWAHAWSSGDPRYTEHETSTKLERWSSGPPTCETLARHGGDCAGCTHKVKSPITLGYMEHAPSVPLVIADEPEDATPTQSWKHMGLSELPWFPSAYQWNGGMLRRIEKNSDGVNNYAEVSDVWWYPYARYRTEAGTAALRCCVVGRKHRWRDFQFDIAILADPRKFKAELYSREIMMTEQAHRYVVDCINALANLEHETDTISSFGWNDDGFVLGPNLITKKGVQPVLLGSKIPTRYHDSFGMQAGTAERWTELVNHIYNRPGAEAYQFLICAAFGSPLVQLAAADMWHGIPIALTGASGLGKTTTCLVACSAFGPPNGFKLSANDAGTSVNALIQLFAIMRNLPLVLDEVQGMRGTDLPSLLYALSNGHPKNTLTATRQFRDDGLGWNMLSFVTSNDSIHALLSANHRAKAEATQVRCFEIPLPRDYNQRVFSDINAKDLIDNQLLGQQYGVVGRKFLTLVDSSRDRIAAALMKKRAQYNPTTQEESKERFYFDTIATALVGGSIAKALGIIDFDLSKVEQWALKHVETLRSTRADMLPGFYDEMATILSVLAARTVRTRKFLRSATDTTVEHVDLTGVRDPIARYASEDNVVIVSAAGLRKICENENIVWSAFIAEAQQRGCLRPDVWAGGVNGMVNLFKGTDTSLRTLRTKCYIINLDALGQHAKHVTDNIVNIDREAG